MVYIPSGALLPTWLYIHPPLAAAANHCRRRQHQEDRFDSHGGCRRRQPPLADFQPPPWMYILSCYRRNKGYISLLLPRNKILKRSRKLRVLSEIGSPSDSQFFKIRETHFFPLPSTSHSRPPSSSQSRPSSSPSSTNHRGIHRRRTIAGTHREFSGGRCFSSGLPPISPNPDLLHASISVISIIGSTLLLRWKQPLEVFLCSSEFRQSSSDAASTRAHLSSPSLFSIAAFLLFSFVEPATGGRKNITQEGRRSRGVCVFVSGECSDQVHPSTPTSNLQGGQVVLWNSFESKSGQMEEAGTNGRSPVDKWKCQGQMDKSNHSKPTRVVGRGRDNFDSILQERGDGGKDNSGNQAWSKWHLPVMPVCDGSRLSDGCGPPTGCIETRLDRDLAGWWLSPPAATTGRPPPPALIS
ncbi:hypothetical protein LXL04_019879 [Taraxacum kok-saghyz]